MIEITNVIFSWFSILCVRDMFETLWCIDEELKQQQPRPEGWPSKPKDAGNQNLSCRWILSCGRTSVATSCKSRDKNFKRGWTCSAWDRTWPLCTNGWMGGASAALFPQELSFLDLQPIIAFPLNIYKLSRCKCNAAWGKPFAELCNTQDTAGSEYHANQELFQKQEIELWPVLLKILCDLSHCK